MTKSKRFVMKDPNDWGYPITDTDTGKVYSCASNIWMKELCTDINKIVDENEKLKEENKSWLKTASHMDRIHHEDREYCERLYKENVQLKQIIDRLTLDNTKQKKVLNATKKENEQLKQELAKKK